MNMYMFMQKTKAVVRQAGDSWEGGNEMRLNRFRLLFALSFLLGGLLIGCGGGGEQSTGTGSHTPTLAWDPPRTYIDNTPLDPYRDLDYYEFYVSSNTNFTENDMPVAQVAAISNDTLTNEFLLINLLPFSQPGRVCYISIRSVGADGLKSNFSAPVAWDLT
jgi:hypothetical protein